MLFGDCVGCRGFALAGFSVGCRDCCFCCWIVFLLVGFRAWGALVGAYLWVCGVVVFALV